MTQHVLHRHHVPPIADQRRRVGVAELVQRPLRADRRGPAVRWFAFVAAFTLAAVQRRAKRHPLQLVQHVFVALPSGGWKEKRIGFQCSAFRVSLQSRDVVFEDAHQLRRDLHHALLVRLRIKTGSTFLRDTQRAVARVKVPPYAVPQLLVAEAGHQECLEQRELRSIHRGEQRLQLLGCVDLRPLLRDAWPVASLHRDHGAGVAQQLQHNHALVDG